MNRREALRHAGRVATLAALWASLPARSWAALAEPEGWNEGDESLLTLIGDTIVPATSGSPGAGAVGIGRFIVWMTRECYLPGAEDALRRGLREIRAQAEEQSGRAFADLAVPEREALLATYEKRAAAASKGGAVNPFRHIKELTLLGYFTSEPGATKALRYDPVPGAYHGSVPLADDDRAWAL